MLYIVNKHQNCYLTSFNTYAIIYRMKTASSQSKMTTQQSAKKAARTLKRGSSRKAAKPSTVRLDPNLQPALDNLSNTLGKTKNKIFNEAVADYLEKSGFQLRSDLEATLEQLRAYRAKDPNFEADIEAFAASEASLAHKDEHEGRIQAKSESSLSHDTQNLMHA